MDKNQQKNILIITLLVVALLMVAFFIWWQFLRGDEPEIDLNTNAAANTNTASVLVNVTNSQANVNVEIDETEEEELSMRRLTNLFTERFGSYNTETEFQNTIDLKTYMTDDLKTWADNYVNDQRTNQGDNPPYYSVVTKVLTTNVLTESDQAATVELMTQRVESGDNFEESNSFNQTMDLELVYENEVWLVNKVTWGDKI